MRAGGHSQLLALASAALLCTLLAPAQGRIRNDGVDDYYVEYEEHELPENETLSDEEDLDWDAFDMLDLYGFDIGPCLETGCTEEMLNNAQCDEPCNSPLCEYDLTLCFKFFDIHGYGWDFEGCEETGCRREQLYNTVCDDECNNEMCHWDNWRCFDEDVYQLYDRAGHGWDDDLSACYAAGCNEALLFNSICDHACNSEVCHFDNFVCTEEAMGMDQTYQQGATRWGRADRREF